MKIKQVYILYFILLMVASKVIAQPNEIAKTIKLLTQQVNYEVGDNIVLEFSKTDNTNPLLYCSSSFGSTLISAISNQTTLSYQIPKHISEKIGVVNWKLLHDEASISGTFFIQPQTKVATMETYLGPTSIDAGGIDYSMLVTIPTDALDNPVPNNTLVTVKHQFLSSEVSTDVFTKNSIAYKNIYSTIEHGKMLVSSESLGINSKEFTINIAPAIPTSFSISAKRPHEYADGNQITTFSTSVIKDKHNNVVSNGTFVTFFIQNSKKNILKTTGLTLNGVATAKIVHPDYGDTWTVKAFVDGMAESNSISLNYQQVIKGFNVTFSNHNRDISIGPLQSFMQQYIPDGLPVKLHIFKNGKHLETLIKTSFNGYVNFNLKPAIFESAIYDFNIETAGITKQFKAKKL